MVNAPNIDRESAIAKTFAAAFAALADFRAKNPEAASRVADVIASHLRAAHPMASAAIPGLDTLDTGPVPRVELGKTAEIARDLGDDHRYRVATHMADGRGYVILSASDGDECVLLTLTPVMAIRLRQDLDDVASAVMR